LCAQQTAWRGVERAKAPEAQRDGGTEQALIKFFQQLPSLLQPSLRIFCGMLPRTRECEHLTASAAFTRTSHLLRGNPSTHARLRLIFSPFSSRASSLCNGVGGRQGVGKGKTGECRFNEHTCTSHRGSQLQTWLPSHLCAHLPYHCFDVGPQIQQ